MVDYRGVPKADVVDSLQRAEAFLRKLTLGPVTTKKLDDWLAKDPYTKIAAATTREEMVQAMNETGSAYVFGRHGMVLQHHGLADTDGTARQLFQDLYRWGALSGAMTLEYGPVDEEIQRHLVLDSFRQLKGKKINSVMSHVKTMFGMVAAQDMASAASGRRMLSKIANMAKEKGEQGVTELFQSYDLSDRYMMQSILFGMTGLAGEMKHIKLDNPFGRYGVVLDENNLMAQGQALREQFEAALEPFRAMDEVMMTGIGGITDPFQKDKLVGLMFEGTKPAAVAVAKAFSGYRVVNGKGENVIEPRKDKKFTPKTPNR